MRLNKTTNKNLSSKAGIQDILNAFRKQFVENRIRTDGSEKAFVIKSDNRYYTADEMTDWLLNALTEFEREVTEKAVEKSLWCPFCGDALDCFGCQVMEDRTMSKRKKLILSQLEKEKHTKKGTNE